MHRRRRRRTSPNLLTSTPSGRLAAARLASTVKEGRPDLGDVLHGGELAATAVAVRVVGTAGEGECLPARSVVQRPGLGVVEANIVDAVALPRGGALQPAEVLLSVAGDLHRRLGGDKVLGDVLPIAAAVHEQPAEELPAVIQN